MTQAPADPSPAHDWLSPVPLRGRLVRLEPLEPQHAAGLARHADADTVRFLGRGGPAGNDEAGWRDHIGSLNALPNRVNWAVIVLNGENGGEVAGRISYSEVRWPDRWLEIGTMITPPFQGGAANPEGKRLLLERAFTELGAGRVQFKVDARNARSRAAMRKLGAVEEGTLRRYQLRPGGESRDSVVFSILPEEWPTVRAGLDARLVALAVPPVS